MDLDSVGFCNTHNVKKARVRKPNQKEKVRVTGGEGGEEGKGGEGGEGEEEGEGEG